MLLEDTAFPIVRIDYDTSGLAESLAAFETLLARRHAFVLIGHGASRQEQDHEERRQIALWMKRHRAALRQFVMALVYVEPQPAARLTARAGAVIYRKFWGYPMIVAASDDEGYAIAARLLAGESAGSITTADQRDTAGQ